MTELETPFVPWTRRALLGGGATLALGLSGAWRASPVRAAPADPDLHAAYPSQDPTVVREVVSAAHGRFDSLRELVDARPELANAAWDWGYGDWETALGAASHVGRRDIAEYLIAHGARPDLFTVAMLGQLETLRALLAAGPGLHRHLGPHGIPLLAHARAGGEPAAGVVAYLEELGGADGPQSVPIDDDALLVYLGRYRFGPGPTDLFVVAPSRMGGIALERLEGTPRRLTFLGEHDFHPAGARSARVRFTLTSGRAEALEIWNPGRVVTARRVG